MMDEGCTSDCTILYVGNLSSAVDEQFLEFFFRSSLEPPMCEVKVLTKSREDSTDLAALINLGCKEKAQQAIRELNGTEIKGKRIQVSLYIRSFTHTPGKKVYLERFKDGTKNMHLYDLVSKLGTVVAINGTYHFSKKDQLFKACVTFLTEEEAQQAIRIINLCRNSDSATFAKSDRRYIAGQAKSSDAQAETRLPNMDMDSKGNVEAPSEGSRSPMEKSTSWHRAPSPGADDSASHAGDSDSRASGSLSPKNRQTDATLGTDEEDEVFTDGEASVEHELLDSIHSASPLDDTASPCFQTEPTLDLETSEMEEKKRQEVYDLLFAQYENEIKPRKWLEKILHVLQNSLDTRHLLQHGMIRERFHFYLRIAEAALEQGKWAVPQLSNLAMHAAGELELFSMATEREQLQAIRKSLYYLGIGRYKKDVLESVLDVLFRHLGIDALLELYGEENRLYRMAFYAKVAMEEKTEFTVPVLSDTAELLILRLELDKLDNAKDWQQALREYMVSVHLVHYGHEYLTTLMDIIFHAPGFSKDVYKLLTICAEEKQFRLLAFYARVAIQNGTNLIQFHLSETLKDLLSRNNLDRPSIKQEITPEWTKAVRDHLMTLYSKKYGYEHLTRVVDKMLSFPILLKSAYDLIMVCCNESRFHLMVFYAKLAIDKKIDSVECTLSKPIEDLVLRDGLDKPLASAMITQQWKVALRQHLVNTYQGLYERKILEQVVDKMLFSTSTALTLFCLLHLCIDVRQFRFMSFFAMRAVENGVDLALPIVSKATMNIILQLDLDKSHSITAWKQKVQEHLLCLYEKRYGHAQLATVLNKVFSSPSISKNVSNVLECCTDETKFRLMAFFAKVSIAKNVDYAQPVLWKEIEDIILRLDLDKLDNTEGWKQALRQHLASVHQKRFGCEHLTKVLDKIFHSSVLPTDTYDLLFFCANERKFRLLAFCSKYAIKENTDLVLPSLNKAVEDLILQSNLDKPDTTVEATTEWEQAVRKHLYTVHQWRYGREQLNTLLDKMFSSTLVTKNVYNLLRFCIDAQSFPLAIFHINVADGKGVDVVPPSLSKEVEDLIVNLGLDRFKTIDRWNHEVRAHMMRIYDDPYGKECVRSIVERILTPHAPPVDIYDLLNYCTNKQRFHLLAMHSRVMIAAPVEGCQDSSPLVWWL